MVDQVYRARKPKASPLWQCLTRHFDAFLKDYEAHYQPRYGFLRPIISDVVNKFLDCGDLERGFARVRCDHCKHEYLLAFSCKGRWFCPSCHHFLSIPSIHHYISKAFWSFSNADLRFPSSIRRMFWSFHCRAGSFWRCVMPSASHSGSPRFRDRRNRFSSASRPA